MGVDTKLMLPCDVRLSDVTLVTGILLGCKKEKHTARVVQAGCVGYENIPDMARIDVTAPGVHASFYYHFEPDDEGPEGAGRLMSARATARNIAMMKRLAQFFGGKVMSSDSKRVWDFEYPRPRAVNNPSGGHLWDDFHNEIFAVEPLVQAELDDVRHLASYDQQATVGNNA